MTIYIEKTATICYYLNMKNYFEYKTIYNEISFCLTDKPSIDEREIHPYNEILYFIDGDCELLTNGNQHPLKSNSILVFPAEAYHFFNMKQAKAFSRLKIGFPSHILESTPVRHITSEIKIFKNPNENVMRILDSLCCILKDQTEKTGFSAYVAFLMLVCELSFSKNDEEPLSDVTNKLIFELTEYVSENLSSNLSVKSLSKKFHISTSSLAHLFKKELGISLHKYILQKRLIYAQKLIINEQKPSKIYSDSGFSDYSSFYKAYLKFFGYPPSKEKDKRS